ncbi:MAG: P1 family peptidase [Deltaproteobacteria bacterium]|nr:P1 family peptidase [Deltaproteobacteria bacterium]
MNDKPKALPNTAPSHPAGRKRARDLGIHIGRYPVGPFNAITDVPGVKVGHTTLIAGEGKLIPGKGPVRTGVTAIHPSPNLFHERVIGGSFVLNGAGEVSGLTQVDEWGLLETPILLTNTMSVGKVSDAAVKWMTRLYPGIGSDHDVVIPVVAECDDSFLNDSVGRHIRSEHVYTAIERASAGPVAEGSVGAGTGMVTCDFKAGIGTASRRVPAEGGAEPSTIGVLVMSNFGVCRNLRVDGVPIGELLEPDYRHLAKRQYSYGSIICVVATDAPLLSPQLGRLCKRAALGIGRSGSYAAHGSGEIIIAFSTANKVPRQAHGMMHRINVLLDEALGPHYEAVIEATEEAILNSLCMAPDMTGQGGNFAPGLPLDKVVALMDRYRPKV